MGEEKEIKKISPKLENIIKGLFSVLFGIMLILNVGKIGRTLSFLPIYLFGTAYYIITALLIFSGIYRIVKQKKFKFPRFSFTVALFFTLVGLSTLVSFIIFKSTGATLKNGDLVNMNAEFNYQLSGWYANTNKTINLFANTTYLGYGLVGVLTLGTLADDVIVVFIAIIFILIASFLFALPLISKLLRKHFGGKEKNDENVEEVTNESFYEEKELPKPEIKYGYESDPKPFINENSGFDRLGPSNEENFSNGQIVNNNVNNTVSEFSPLVLTNDEVSPLNIVQPEIDMPSSTPVANEEMANEEINEVENAFDSEENVPLPESNPEPIMNLEVSKDMQDTISLFDEMNNQVEEKKEETIPTPKKIERVVWVPPSPDILMTYDTAEAQEVNEQVAEKRKEIINRTLANFKVGARCVGYTIGSSVTRFSIEYDPNVTIKSVEKLEQEISVWLGGVVSRFVPIIPGESYSGFEVPNSMTTTVSFKDVFTALPTDTKKHPLAVGFGKDISGKVVYADFNDFPHLLVAGTTGSGKSIYVHSIIATLIMKNSPDDLKIVLVDPKKVEMTKYANMPHLLCPIITEAEKAKVCLQKLVEEMERRYELFMTNPEISDIKQYNAWAKENNEPTIPYIIAVLDEYADLVDNCKEISQPVVSIAQKARSAGIHLLISTQRPSTNVITGVIKGNLPTHVALMTSSYTDSMTIIGEGGAEKLLGKGDMLVQSPLVSRVGVTRLQGCFIQNKEIVHIVNYLKEHYETHYDPNYLDLVDHSKEPTVNVLAPGEVEKETNAEEENKYQSIKEWAMTQQFVSMSRIQRECSVGFNRAGRFFIRLQKEGIVSTEQDGSSKGCRVLVHDEIDLANRGYDSVSSGELID